MLNKRGQVTLFVILAIVIVAGIFVFFSFRDGLQIKPSIPTTIQPIHNFVQNCLEETSENSLVRIGNQGGYFLIFDEPSIEGRIPYYLQRKQNTILTQEEIEQNLAGFIYEELSFCILNFKDFRSEFEIEHNLENINSQILDNQVRFTLDYPVTISKISSEITYQLKDFEINIPIRLDKIYQISEKIIQEQIQHPESICLSCLYDLGENYNVHIDMLDYGNSTIFTIIDDSSKINNQSYEWSFAIE